MSTTIDVLEKYGYTILDSFEYKKIPLLKIRSKRTGLTVVIVNIEGPMVNGYFTLATEAHDDDGCPHVLEHMCFLGSEEFPFKGILDKVANRSLAQGTNAWTATDHTCYTITTAGSEGFLNLLPVYMDHILFPTISAEGFHTEVHHINGEGEDAGVVYCEMQGRENTGPSRTYSRMMQLLYPDGSGYGYETGGKVANLRSLHVEKVRDYHAQFYRPDNLCLIVTGQIGVEEVLKTLAPFEDKISNKRNAAANAAIKRERPWTSPVPPLTKTSTEVVEFPSDEEEGGGMVNIAWRACKWDNFFETRALDVMWKYLTESAVAPLQQIFVENDDPYCNSLYGTTMDMAERAQLIQFKNVPTKKLMLIKDKFFESIRDICEGKNIDMKRMKTVIRLRKVKHLSSFEENAHEAFCMPIIGEFLYGTDPTHLWKSLDEVSFYNELDTMDADFWVNLMKKYLLDQNYVCIIGKPSTSLGGKLAKEEAARLEKQIAELGEAKRKELAEELRKATEYNEREIPADILQSITVPDLKKIPFINVVTYRNDNSALNPEGERLKQHVESDSNKYFPFFIEFDHVKSSFIETTCYMNTQNLPEKLRLYLELYLEVVFQCPIKREDGTLVPYEQVVAELDEESVDHANGCGLSGGNFVCGSFAQLAWLKLKFEEDKYERMIQWMKEFLYHTQFTAERLKIGATKLINDVARLKRNAQMVARAGLKFVDFDKRNCNHNASNFIVQNKFLQELLKRLEESPDTVIAEMNDLRNHLTAVDNMIVHVVGDIFKQQHPKRYWIEKFATADQQNQPPKPVVAPFTLELLSKEATSADNEKKGYVFCLKSTDSSYLVHSTRGIDNYEHPDLAAVLVLIEYLTALEGPLWRQIRGKGFSYGYTINMSIEEGLLYFALSRSGSLFKAYVETHRIIKEFIESNGERFDPMEVDAARSSCIFDLISAEETIIAAAENRMVNYFRRVGADRTQQLLKRVGAVTVEDLKRVLNKYFANMFNVNLSNVVIATNPNKVDEIIDSFESGAFVSHAEDEKKAAAAIAAASDEGDVDAEEEGEEEEEEDGEGEEEEEEEEPGKRYEDKSIKRRMERIADMESFFLVAANNK